MSGSSSKVNSSCHCKSEACRVVNGIINMYSNIMQVLSSWRSLFDNRKKSKTMNGALRDTNINGALYQRLFIKNHTNHTVYYREINIQAENPTSNFCKTWVVRKTRCKILSKALNIVSAAAPAVPDLLRVLAILMVTNVRRSAADLEHLLPYWKLEKIPYFLWWSASLLFIRF